MATTDHHEFVISGMTCAHCVASVREEVSEIPGVRDVGVDLASGRLAVTAETLDVGAIRTAVAEAGYSVTTGSN